MGEVFNVGNDREEVTIRELAERVKARTGSKSEIVTVPYDQAYEEGFEDMRRRVPDLTKVHALVGYEPKVHLDEILDRVIAYFTSGADAPRRAPRGPGRVPADVRGGRAPVVVRGHARHHATRSWRSRSAACAPKAAPASWTRAAAPARTCATSEAGPGPCGFDLSPDALRFCRARGVAAARASVLALPVRAAPSTS